MPIYEFVCSGCEREFEKLVMGASARVVCPHCGSGEVERRLSVFGVKSGGKFTPSAAPGCAGCSPASPGV